jgi:hypothetical protein
MAVFPRTESGINELAVQMMTGLSAHAALYPSVTPEALTDLTNAYNEYNNKLIAQGDARAAAKNATIEKNEAQDSLETEMNKILYLAEHDCIEDPGNLEYIGWSDRKDPSPLQGPGQPGELVPTYEGPGTLSLKWGKPSSGGAVSSYRIERSDQPQGGGIPGPWTLISTTYETNTTLSDQPRGTEMQYRVTATNAAGESMPSNIATVVL